MKDKELKLRIWKSGEEAAWLADKIVTGSQDYCRDASLLLLKYSQLEKQHDELQRHNEMLISKVQAVLPFVITQTVACHGLKCRELVCESCSCDADVSAQKASDAYAEISSALSAISAQSAEWLEASHIEWMKNLKPALWISPEELPFVRDSQNIYSTIENFDGCTLPLYSIPEKKD